MGRLPAEVVGQAQVSTGSRHAYGETKVSDYARVHQGDNIRNIQTQNISIYLNGVTSLVWNLYKRCRHAPQSYYEISQDLNSLHAVFMECEEAYSGYELSALRLQRLQSILSGCQTLVTDLEEIVSKYEGLGLQQKLTWDRMKWHNEDINIIRTRITSQVGLLTAFVATSQLSVVQKLQNVLTEFQRGNMDKSIVSVDSLNPDQKAEWRAVRKEFESHGITLDMFQEHRNLIFTWLDRAMASGEFDEQLSEYYIGSASQMIAVTSEESAFQNEKDLQENTDTLAPIDAGSSSRSPIRVGNKSGTTIRPSVSKEANNSELPKSVDEAIQHPTSPRWSPVTKWSAIMTVDNNGEEICLKRRYRESETEAARRSLPIQKLARYNSAEALWQDPFDQIDETPSSVIARPPTALATDLSTHERCKRPENGSQAALQTYTDVPHHAASRSGESETKNRSDQDSRTTMEAADYFANWNRGGGVKKISAETKPKRLTDSDFYRNVKEFPYQRRVISDMTHRWA